MNAVLAAGAFAAVGFGIFVIARSLFPAPTPLAVIAHELHRPRTPTPPPGTLGWWTRLANRTVGAPNPRHTADLAVIERTVARHALDKLGYGVLLAVVPTMMGAGLGAARLHPPAGAFAAAVAGMAALGWVLPDTLLKASAAKARREWSYVLATYLDVVVILLAGGAGPEEALNVAAEAGDGHEFTALRQALTTARLRRQTPWAALGHLGTERDIRPLRELAAAMTLAGIEGSKVRASLIAKAEALRTRQLAEAETAEQKAAETMTIAPAAIVGVFVLLITYPAVMTFLAT